ASSWAVLMEPQLARLRMKGKALGVAVTVAPYFRTRSLNFHERIVLRDGAISFKAHHRTIVGGKQLSIVPVPAISHSEKNKSVFYGYSGAKVLLCFVTWLTCE